ncbi:MAG: carboxymuconolactone decarboxylase family protein [Betaproteobacteria bacterium]|nr:carboxymuconolactone decarboxylase family protein [Betaproteobacteria bacterium]
MSDLTPRDRELVALGAAMGSNCVPCVEYHIPASRKAGLTDPEIQAAILHADKIRQVPARKTLQAALAMLPSAAGDAPRPGTGEDCGCGAEHDAGSAGTGKTAQPMEAMAGMMSKMMDICGSHGQSAGAPNSAAKEPAGAAAKGCGCD